jgi:hypothetical protein
MRSMRVAEILMQNDAQEAGKSEQFEVELCLSDGSLFVAVVLFVSPPSVVFDGSCFKSAKNPGTFGKSSHTDGFIIIGLFTLLV